MSAISVALVIIGTYVFVPQVWWAVYARMTTFQDDPKAVKNDIDAYERAFWQDLLVRKQKIVDRGDDPEDPMSWAPPMSIHTSVNGTTKRVFLYRDNPNYTEILKEHQKH